MVKKATRVAETKCSGGVRFSCSGNYDTGDSCAEGYRDLKDLSPGISGKL